MDLLMTVWAEWQRRKNQTNVCPNTRNQGAAQDYSMEKTSPPESHVLKNTQKCPSLAWIQHSSEEMLAAGTWQHLERPGEGTFVFPLCKFWLPISKLCSLSNLLILHCQTNLFCCKKLLGLSSSQVHPASCCTDSWAGRALTMSQALEGIKLGWFFQSVKVKKPKMWSVSVPGFQGQISGCAACGASCCQGAATQDTALLKIKMHPYSKCIILSSYKKNLLERGRWKIRFYSLLKGWAAVYQTLCTPTNTHISLLQISCSLHS